MQSMALCLLLWSPKPCQHSKASVQIPVRLLHSRGRQGTPPCHPWGAAPAHIPLTSALSQTQNSGSHPQQLSQTLGRRLPSQPRLPLPAAHTTSRQRAASPALILTSRKVPIVHFQSCFKVTLISKLLAALAGDYSCINQGEIMPVTD